MNEQELSRLITDVASEVHHSVGGQGLEPVVYRDALAYELEKRGLSVEQRTIQPGRYPGVTITRPEKIDMIVNDQVLVECKTDFSPRYEAQSLARLRMAGLKLALIINFGERSLRNAIRVVTSNE